MTPLSETACLFMLSGWSSISVTSLMTSKFLDQDPGVMKLDAVNQVYAVFDPCQ